MRQILALSMLLVLVGCKQHEEKLYFSCFTNTPEAELRSFISFSEPKSADLLINKTKKVMIFDDETYSLDYRESDFYITSAIEFTDILISKTESSTSLPSPSVTVEEVKYYYLIRFERMKRKGYLHDAFMILDEKGTPFRDPIPYSCDERTEIY